MSLRVLAPGVLTSVQDLGRRGHAAIGVGSAGAMDSVALRLANRLVGNPENAGVLEMTLRGPRLRFEAECMIALSGAELGARCGDESVPSWRPIWIRAGTEVDFGAMRRGLRSYLALAGGIDVAPMLGSRSSDINAGLGSFGGRALAAGDVLPIGTRPHAGREQMARLRDEKYSIVAVKWSIDPAPWFDPDGPTPIALTHGTHFDHLDAASQHTLFDAEFHIGADSNRVGYRFEGRPLALSEPLELVSESVVPGCMQLPPNGNPIVLLAEAPTTGGYPRIAHAIGVDLPRLAQRRPGSRVRFIQTSLADAQTRYLERERALAALAQTIAERIRT
jgi:antagonist of KipI